MRQKIRSGRWTVPPTGHKKGGGIQGIRTASAAGAETLSDALGTRLQLLLKFKDVSDTDQHFYALKQFQINNLIRKSDGVNKPLHQFYDAAAVPCVQ